MLCDPQKILKTKLVAGHFYKSNILYLLGTLCLFVVVGGVSKSRPAFAGFLFLLVYFPDATRLFLCLGFGHGQRVAGLIH